MDHQVQHHIHVERAGCEDGEPVRLKEHGPAQLRLHGQHRRIEAFQMSRLQNASADLRNADQIVSLGQRSCQWLFDEQIEARIQQGRGHGVMVHRGDGNRGCVKL